jgi:hypothetical protein
MEVYSWQLHRTMGGFSSKPRLITGGDGNFEREHGDES